MGDSVSLKYLAALNLFSPEFSPSLQRSLPLPLPPAPRSTIAAHPQVYKCRQSLGSPGAALDPGCDTVEVFFFVYSGLFRSLHNARHHSICASSLFSTEHHACSSLVVLPSSLRGCGGVRGEGEFLMHLAVR